MERARLALLRILGGLFAFVFWVPSLALVDLAAGLLPEGSDATSSHSFGNLGYGVIGSVFVAPAFACHVRRSHLKVASLQQLAVVSLALAVAALASGALVGVLGAVLVLVPLVVVFALHPRRRDALRLPDRRRASRPLLALVLIAFVPAAVYASAVASNGRANIPPDAAASYAYVPTLWSATVAMTVATILVAFAAASRPSGWPFSAACIAVAAFLFGIASTVNPEVPASPGRAWGAAAILWSFVWSATAVHEWKRNDDVRERERRDSNPRPPA